MDHLAFDRIGVSWKLKCVRLKDQKKAEKDLANARQKMLVDIASVAINVRTQGSKILRMKM